MKVTATELPEVLVIEPRVFEDRRGFFLESWHRERYAEHGIDADFVQDNHSRSARGVLRGLHFQLRKPQGKLVRVTRGTVFDVAVDIRRDSPTYGRWAAATLSGDNHRQLWVPPGFAHGFCVLSETADFLYKCTEFYDADDERGIAWNDPDIGIEWPGEGWIVSERDARNPTLSEFDGVSRTDRG